MATILAVDDSSAIRQMISFILKSEGFEVVEAADGLAALALAKKQVVQAVLTDMNMPQMDGVSLVKELRKLPAYKFTPMLMLTTESASDKKSGGESAGVTGWLVKPFNPEQLVNSIKRLVR